MAITRSYPMRFTPRGLVDAYDSTDKFPGACTSMANLVFDQSNPEVIVSRPGVVSLADLATAGMTSPTFISVQASIGTRTYGMVATTTNAGKDEPFCYDTATSLLVTITGMTSHNVPTTQATSGDWTPPTIAAVGTMILITHPGFDGDLPYHRFFGMIDITNPAAPVWSSQQTAVNPLLGVPKAVANFNNRAYFAVGNSLQYTDVLTNPPTITLASQSLTLGDAAAITALSGMPITTASSGAVGALIAFKPTQVWQITGDTAFGNLSENYISLTDGTNMPRTVAQSPLGLYFGSTAGPRLVDPFGVLRFVTNRMDALDSDIVAPFLNATTPSRWAGVYASGIYRCCGPTIIGGQAVTNDYWFDERKRRWTGPHSFQYDCASAMGGYFVLTSSAHNGLLVRSDPVQNLSSVYTDLGTVINAVMASSTFPKAHPMSMKQVAESQIELSASGGNVTYTIVAEDDQGNTLDSTFVAIVPVGGLWNATVWGDGHKWMSSVNIPHPVPVPWTAPLVFEKMQLRINALATGDVQIGTFYGRYQDTGYMTLGG